MAEESNNAPLNDPVSAAFEKAVQDARARHAPAKTKPVAKPARVSWTNRLIAIVLHVIPRRSA
jgi:hypothetical protein